MTKKLQRRRQDILIYGLYLFSFCAIRMDKEEMMRICRAMAMFRPSFIALIMNLTPEDLIFMEKCFQRTILVSVHILDVDFLSSHYSCSA